MVKRISEATVDKLAKATDEICTLVEEGQSPNSAAVKVANQYGLTPGQIRLVGRSYNIGVVNEDRESSDDFNSKFAVTSRLDADFVISELFPNQQKLAAQTASSTIASVYRSDRDKLSQQIKEAGCDKKKSTKKVNKSPYAVFDTPKKKSNYEQAKDLSEEIKELKKNANRLESLAVQKCAAVIDAYAAQYGQQVEPIYWLRKAASDRFGRVGAMLVDNIATSRLNRLQMDKYASHEVSGPQPIKFDYQVGVLRAIKEATESVTVWAEAECAYPQQVFQLRQKISKLTKPAVTDTSLTIPGYTRECVSEARNRKQSAALSGLLGGLAVSMNRSAPPATEPNTVLDAKIKLNDPSHMAELRRIEAESMLNRLINSDEVISSYDPDEVAAAVDEIAQSTPGLFENQSLLRANMRRQLQGNLTPMDAADMFEQSRLVSTPTPPLTSSAIKDPLSEQKKDKPKGK